LRFVGLSLPVKRVSVTTPIPPFKLLMALPSYCYDMHTRIGLAVLKWMTLRCLRHELRRKLGIEWSGGAREAQPLPGQRPGRQVGTGTSPPAHATIAERWLGHMTVKRRPRCRQTKFRNKALAIQAWLHLASSSRSTLRLCDRPCTRSSRPPGTRILEVFTESLWHQSAFSHR
jgi:hypothetical protein